MKLKLGKITLEINPQVHSPWVMSKDDRFSVLLALDNKQLVEASKILVKYWPEKSPERIFLEQRIQVATKIEHQILSAEKIKDDYEKRTALELIQEKQKELYYSFLHEVRHISYRV